MAFALYVAGSMLAFALCCWRLWLYSWAIKKSMGRLPLGPESLPFYMRRQAEPHMESLRRWVWAAFGFWVVYAVFGLNFWAAVVGSKS